MTSASTVFPGVIEKESILGLVFSTTMDAEDSIEAPSLSVADAVQTISSVGFVVFASMVSVFPTDARGVPSVSVQV